MLHVKVKLLFLGMMFLIAVALAMIACGPISPEYPSRNVQSQSTQTEKVDIKPTWTIKTDSDNVAGGTIDIYVAKTFYWAKDEFDKIDSTEKLAVITFLENEPRIRLNTAKAEIRYDPPDPRESKHKIMFIYPFKEDVDDFEKDRERVINIITGGVFTFDEE